VSGVFTGGPWRATRLQPWAARMPLMSTITRMPSSTWSTWYFASLTQRRWRGPAAGLSTRRPV